MSKIQRLNKELINLIAAGEVIERPASAIKELLENSIDAGSTKITINIESENCRNFSIEDNGEGIEFEDLAIALDLHATSKIHKIEDIDNITTLGFRGEALASITEISKSLKLTSKTTNSEGSVVKSYGEQKIENIGLDTTGTKIEIVELFSRVPARLKFLKTDSTEQKNFLDTIKNTILPFLNIELSIFKNKELFLKIPKTDSMINRIHDVFGLQISKNLFEKVIEGDSTFRNIKLFFSNPNSMSKTSPKHYIYVNNRYVLSKTIIASIIEAYKGYIHKDLKPNFFIFIHIRPEMIDVNIHPRKLEVKFTDEQILFRTIFTNIRTTLNNASKTYIEEEFYSSNKPILESKTKESQSTFPNNFELTSKQPSFFQKKHKDAFRFNQSLFEPGNFVQEKATVYSTNLDSGISYSSTPFQIFKTYIVIEKQKKILFIDQHALAEKITFEKLIKDRGNVSTKPLLIPEIIELLPEEKEFLNSNSTSLKEIGFIFEDLGKNSISINEVPLALTVNDVSTFVNSVLNPDLSFEKMYLNSKNNQQEIFKEISKVEYLRIATIACRNSLKAGKTLSEEEMRDLISQLENLNDPHSCPHGRPIIWELSQEELEKNFLRKI